MAIANNYLHDRSIIAYTEEVMRFVTKCGVPQGSVLGPLLCYMIYDDLLKMELQDGAEVVTYANDLALLLASRTERQVENTANIAIT